MSLNRRLKMRKKKPAPSSLKGSGVVSWVRCVARRRRSWQTMRYRMYAFACANEPSSRAEEFQRQKDLPAPRKRRKAADIEDPMMPPM